MIEIKNRYTRVVLFRSKTATRVGDAVVEAVNVNADLSYADLSNADLSSADLSNADLSNADLRYADLSDADLHNADMRNADLRYADLSDANLSCANLRYANLRHADVRYAEGIAPERATPLMMLLDQPGKIRLYKLVMANGYGPWRANIRYEIGKTITVANADTDANHTCGAGINVATLDWCLKEWREGYKVLVVEFTANDIACIPIATDGKLRLHKCKVVGEKDLTGLVPDADGEWRAQ